MGDAEVTWFLAGGPKTKSPPPVSRVHNYTGTLLHYSHQIEGMAEACMYRSGFDGNVCARTGTGRCNSNSIQLQINIRTDMVERRWWWWWWWDTYAQRPTTAGGWFGGDTVSGCLCWWPWKGGEYLGICIGTMEENKNKEGRKKEERNAWPHFTLPHQQCSDEHTTFHIRAPLCIAMRYSLHAQIER